MEHFLVSIATLVAVLLALAVLVYLVGKSKWIIQAIERLNRRNDGHFRHLFRQVQILSALHDQLRLPHILPPTGGKAGSPDFLKALADLILTTGPKTVVECGSGLSTVVAARCLQLKGAGHVFSLEHMAEFAAVTRDELARQNLSEWATIIDAPLIPTEAAGRKQDWYRLDGLPEGQIDILVVDGPPARTGKEPRYPAGPKLFPSLAPDGVIVIDDAGRPEERAVIDLWRREFGGLRFTVNTDDFQKGLCLARRVT